MQKLEKLRPFLPLTGFLVFFYIVSQLLPKDAIIGLITKAGFAGPVVFIILSLVAAVFAPLSGTPITFVGFYLYGHKVIFLVSFAAWISYAVNFLIARKWGRPLVKKFIGAKSLEKVDEFIDDYGHASLFFLRLFGGSFHDFISYAMGLTKMPFLSYLITSWLAAIPGTLVWYLISLQTQSALVFTLITFGIGTIFTGFFILWRNLSQTTKITR